MDKKFSFRNLFEQISPILIDPSLTSIKLELSKRFLLFEFLNKLTKKIEDDPYLNFLSILKYYKVLGKTLHATIYEMHRDRNKAFLKDFFWDHELYNQVKDDLEWAYAQNKHMKITMTKRGIMMYDNYNTKHVNMLLLTVHSGSWMPMGIKKKQILSDKDRLLEEDIDTHKIYGSLVLRNHGIWIDNKMSRFALDYNRAKDHAIYDDGQEHWLDEVWKEKPSTLEKTWLMRGYEKFYALLEKLIETYRFNIIFDGHSMSDHENRPDISFGTEYIPHFYQPIVRRMQRELQKKGYHTQLNTPYKGGNIIQWLHTQFPDVFTFSIEINKRLYMTTNRTKVMKKKRDTLANDLVEVFG